MSKPKNWKSRLPYLDFIFLNEEEKQEYCALNNICYVRNLNGKEISFLINNNSNIINIYNIKLEIKNNNNTNNNIIKNNEFNQSEYLYSKINDNTENLDFYKKNNVKKYQEPFELYNIFNDSIYHILFSKPFFDNIRNAPLKKLE